MVTEIELRARITRLDGYIRAQELCGPDPYDALACPWARWLRGPARRQAFVQFVRRAPIDVRPVLRIPKTRMAKAVALYLTGLNRAPYLQESGQSAPALVDELRGTRTEGAWGYEFAVQTRWGFYPARTPNIIATSFVVEALSEIDRLDEDDPALAFLERDMLHPRGYVRYVPLNDHLIHNANLLGARALQRLRPGHPAVERAVAVSLDAQTAQGLWPYGEGPRLQWIDNFHTVYVLLALRDLLSGVPGLHEALARGIDAWTTSCFEPDGTPRYLANKRGRPDVHNIATAVHGLAVFSGANPLAARLLDGALDRLLSMQRRDGAFVAHRRAPAYMRWNQAHAFRALVEVYATRHLHSARSPVVAGKSDAP